MKVYEITPNLFIRGRFNRRANKLESLRTMGVSTVVCCLRKFDPDLQGLVDIEYHVAPLADAKTFDEEKQKRAWDIAWVVSRDILAGKKVLVHCMGAKDRSPLVAALVLHILYGWSGLQAVQHIRSVKPKTFYNEGHRQYLAALPARNPTLAQQHLGAATA